MQTKGSDTMNAYFASSPDAFDNFISPKNPIQYSQRLEDAPQQSHNDEELLALQKAKKEAIRCAIGLVLYAIGLFLFAYGQLIQPSLLLMLAGSAVLVLGCRTFIPNKDISSDAEDSDDLESKF